MVILSLMITFQYLLSSHLLSRFFKYLPQKKSSVQYVESLLSWLAVVTSVRNVGRE